jgi:predicted kinase
MRACAANAADRRRLARVRAWSEAELAGRRAELSARKAGGFVRECHGDLHLANMVLLPASRRGGDDRIVIFDCLEFSDTLRWIDVMSDVAFVCMDLEARGHTGLARRLLNGYLEASGDYAGLAVWRLYRVYRALVRAKVACIRWRQTPAGEPARPGWRRDYRRYAVLAGRFTRPARPFMLLMRGLSGSGKTVLSQQLVEALGAVRVRSDVERKRLFGVAPTARSGSGLDRGLYGRDANQRTYERLAELARAILRAGVPVIVDAACLQRAQRAVLRRVAEELGTPFVMLDLQAPAAVLRARVARREREGRDASEAGREVLDRQLAAQEPLTADERARALIVRTDRPVNLSRLADAIGRALTRGTRARGRRVVPSRSTAAPRRKSALHSGRLPGRRRAGRRRDPRGRRAAISSRPSSTAAPRPSRESRR